MSRLGNTGVDGCVARIVGHEHHVQDADTTGDVRVVEEGAAGYGARGRYDPPKLWISLLSFVFLLLCQGKGGGRHERGAAKRG